MKLYENLNIVFADDSTQRDTQGLFQGKYAILPM